MEKYTVDVKTPFLDPDVTRKCGEVFLGDRGAFTFVCSQCLQSFHDLARFGEHVHDIHLHPIPEAVVSTILEDEVAHLQNEPVDKRESDEELHKVEEQNDKLPNMKSPATLSVDRLEDSVDHGAKRRKRQIISKRKHRKSYCCFSCGRILTAFGTYYKHYRVEHPEMIEKVNLCETESCNESEFVPIVPDEMVCKYCLKAFVEPDAFHTHMEEGHTDKLYCCTHCPTTFKDGSSRDYHIDAHEGNRRFQCSHCPMAFSHPTNLRRHVNIHLNNKKYTCQFCGQKYIRGSDLRIHERIHTKEKPYQCEECGMSFIAQVKLTDHMRRHKNIKNYKCTYCEKAFFSSALLKNHIRTHTRETPFTCDICSQKFRTKATLRSHKLLHSDEKKYECSVCGKLFAQGPGLYAHMKSHGGLKQ